ncbi:SDR family NAD(P)-dependent oxidoreductase [Halobacillus halophilus]|uniref:SDR family NAD(P)-dependent oxidoreductase n=1 Tax=Halobacillus halophilus TaxID=1570 RepID=UPI0013696515|nr:SDR family oxidoreductase [Halobacillus halophilus]MYL28829.1 SDR family NAD(P)-dependent oxidoreductase [Halobacillus halophilus]
MNERLKGKKILITGASSGIGQFLAIHAAAEGAVPILTARSEDKLKLMSETIKSTFGISCPWYKADLSNDAEWKDTIDRICYEQGSVDALINNAGVAVFDYVADSNWQDIDRMVSVNVTSLFRATHQLLPHLLQNGEGHIVNIASQAGKMATPKSAVYAATKHAVLGFTNALRMEVEPLGLHVTSVNLGPVRTNFFKQADPSGNYEKAVDKMMLDPNKVARVVISRLFTKQREINLPSWMNSGSKVYAMAPSAVEKIMHKQFKKK